MITLADMRREQNPALQMALMLAMWNLKLPTYQDWVALVEKAVSRALDELMGRRNYFNPQGKHPYGEDALTQTVCMALRGGGLAADSKMVNGNCDLVISHWEYAWIGEAKIADDYNKVYGGYLQLKDRYAKGTPGNTSLGMLLYCFEAQAVAAMAAWQAALTEQEPDSAPTSCVPPHPLQFRSSSVCAPTGVPLSIVHMGVGLRFEPMEKMLKLTPSARKKARIAKANTKDEVGSNGAET